MQPLVNAAVADQFLMRAGLGNPAAIEYHNFVGAPDSGEPVRDHDHRAVAHQGLERPLHQHFRFGVQMRSSFVQDQDRRVLEQCPRDGQTLSLAAAELGTTFADHGVIARRHALDEFVGQGVTRSFANLGVSGFGAAVANVISDSVVE